MFLHLAASTENKSSQLDSRVSPISNGTTFNYQNKPENIFMSSIILKEGIL